MPKNEITNAWLIKASHDLAAAKIIVLSIPEYHDVIAFHCQQAIEKALKGYLVFLEIEFKPVHDLGYLINLVSTKDDAFDLLYDDVDRISRFAVQIRYPDTIITLTPDQVRDAIAVADRIYDLVSDKV